MDDRKPYYNPECPVCNEDYDGQRSFLDGCWCSTGCDSLDCVAAMADAAYERATRRFGAEAPTDES